MYYADYQDYHEINDSIAENYHEIGIFIPDKLIWSQFFDAKALSKYKNYAQGL